jgi:hypothetical protein
LGYNVKQIDLTTLIPNTTSSQSFKLLTRESSSQTPFSVKLELENEYTYVPQTIIPASASYIDNWLVITGSFNLESNNFYSIKVHQYVGSTFVKELYRGEIYATTASAIILDSSPMEGYVASASVNEYIIYE